MADGGTVRCTVCDTMAPSDGWCPVCGAHLAGTEPSVPSVQDSPASRTSPTTPLPMAQPPSPTPHAPAPAPGSIPDTATQAAAAAPAPTVDLADPPRRPGRPQRALPVIATVAVFVLIAVLIGRFASAHLGNEDPPVTRVILEPADRVGPDAFTPTASVGPVVGGPTTPASSATVPTPDRLTAQPVSGDTPGLYGGTPHGAGCDRRKIGSYLAAHPAKARAWAAVLGIRTGSIEQYLDQLTPVVLMADTRVRNHGFRDGRSTEREAVLQAGTAVLVDRSGVPRVRCSCGNPLLPAASATSADGAVSAQGTPWPAFGADSIQVPVAATTPIATFTLRPVAAPGGDRFDRPAGTDGGADVPTPDVDPSPAPSGRPVRSTDVVTMAGIGPLKIGMSYEEARAATGGGVEVLGGGETDACVSLDFGRSSIVSGIGGDGVVRVLITTADNPTADGIHKGSTIAEVRATYGDRLQEDTDPSSPDDLVLAVADPSRADRQMQFLTDDGVVSSITVNDTGYGPAALIGCA